MMHTGPFSRLLSSRRLAVRKTPSFFCFPLTFLYFALKYMNIPPIGKDEPELLWGSEGLLK